MNLIKLQRQNRLFWIVSIASLVGVILTIYGLLQQKWPDVLPLASWSSAISYFTVMGSCALLITLLSCLTHKRLPIIVISLGILLAILAEGVGPLLFILLYSAASLSLGHIILRLLKISSDSISDVYKLLIGAGGYASLISLSAHFSINYSWVYYCILLIPIFLSRFWLLERIRSLAVMLFRPSAPMDFYIFPKSVFGMLCLFYFAFAFFPEISFDSLAMHLFVPVHVAVRHAWGFNPKFYIWTFMPMLGDWNYCIGYVIAGEAGARLINTGFIYLMTYIGRDLVLWAGGNDRGALWGMLLFLATPLTFLVGSSLCIEPIWACYLLAGLLWIFRASTDHNYRAAGIVLAGIMLGLAVSAKAVTLIYLPVFVLPVLFCWSQFFSKPFYVSLVKGTISFLMLGSIPYITGYLMAGNPVFPFYNAYFKSPFYPAVNFNNPLYNAKINLALPYQFIFSSQKYSEGTLGGGGFQWLLLLIPIVILIFLFNNKRSIALFTIGVLSLAFVFHFQSYLRYVFPNYLILSVLAGVALTHSRQVSKLLKRYMVILVSITIGLNLMFLSAPTWGYRDLPVMQVISQSDRNDLSLKRAPIRKAIELVNLLNDKCAPVAFFSLAIGAGLNSDALYIAWYNPDFQNEIIQMETPESLVKILKKYNAKYIIVDSFWCDTSCTAKQRDIIENATKVISSFGTVSVRVLKNELDNISYNNNHGT